MSKNDSRDSLIKKIFDKALLAQQPVAKANVERLRRVHPHKSPSQIIQILDKWYLGTISASGAGAGMAAVVPNGAVQVPATVADLAAYLEASILYALSIMEVHEVDVDDLERRKMLVSAVLLGNKAATKILDKVVGKVAPHWGKNIVKAIPMEAVKNINKVMGPRFVTKWGTKQGTLVLGKQIPLAVGAVVGGVGNGLFGWFVVKAAREIFGSAPEWWSDGYENVVEGEIVN